MRILPLIIMLAACSTKGSKITTNNANYDLLQEKAALYTELVQDHQDEHGFIMTDKCDSLIFSGLLSAAAPELDININAARDNNGAWYRRPNHDCGPDIGNSRSTISRDGIIGVMWHMWRNKDLDTATELMESLRGNLYRLEGQGTVGELLLTPAMINTLALIIKKLGGKEYSFELALPVLYQEAPKGFQRHLSTLQILLQAELNGYITAGQFRLLEKYKNDEPLNPLFKAAYHKYFDGNQEEAITRLLDTLQWPADKLPTNANHCDSWPIERAYTAHNWGPCPPYEEEHTGAELIVVFGLVIKR